MNNIFDTIKSAILQGSPATSSRLAIISASRLHPCGITNSPAVFARWNATRLYPSEINNSRVTLTRNSGFTLVEILVALAIIAIALAALMKASGSHTYSTSYIKEKTLAHFVAMNEVEKLRLDKDWPDLGTEKKSTEMANHEWYWTREIEKMMDPITGKPTDQFIQVVFTVYGDENRANNLAKITAYISRVDAASSVQVPAGQTSQ